MRDVPRVERSRIRLLTGGLALAFTLVAGSRSRGGAASPPEVTVYKNPT